MAKKEPRRGLMMSAEAARQSKSATLPPVIVSEDEMEEIRQEVKRTGVKVVQICMRKEDVDETDHIAYSATLRGRLRTVRCQECNHLCRTDPLAGPGLEYVRICCVHCVPIVAYREKLKRMGA